MRHATPLDAFNAAANLTQQTLQPLTKAKEYELDAEIYRRSIDLSALQNRLILDYTRIDPAGNNKWQQNPEAYQQYVERELLKWRKDADEAGNGSAYYKRRLDELEAQGKLAMGQRYNAAVVDVEQKRVDVAAARAITATRNSNMTPVQAAINELKIEQKRNDLNTRNPKENYAATADTVTFYFNRAAVPDIETLPKDPDGILSVQAAREQLDRKVQAYLEEVKGFLGKEPDQYIPDKKNILEDARKASDAAVRERNFNAAKDAHGDYQLAVQRAEESGEAADLQRVLQMQREGATWRDTVRRSEDENFTPEDRYQMLTWYALPQKLTETKEKITRTELETLLKRARYQVSI